jgi:hypothetical protein
MGVEHQWAAQRNLTAPPTSYTVVGPSSDRWPAAAGLAQGVLCIGRRREARCRPGGQVNRLAEIDRG